MADQVSTAQVVIYIWDRQAIDVNEVKIVNANANTNGLVTLDLSAFADSELVLVA